MDVLPDGCATSQATTCKDIMQGVGKENEGVSLVAHSSSGVGSPLK